MMKQIYELTCDEIRTFCNKREDCTGCKLMYENGVCAKELTNSGENDLQSLFKFLRKAVDV